MLNLHVGQSITVKPHTRYQYLKNGAEIIPAIPYEVAGYETTIYRISEDELETLDGQPVIEYIIETATGEQVRPFEIEPR